MKSESNQDSTSDKYKKQHMHTYTG